jgi:hypothetical protein
MPGIRSHLVARDHGLHIHGEFCCPYCLENLLVLEPAPTEKQIRDVFYGTIADTR